jgi:hypothetical protein
MSDRVEVSAVVKVTDQASGPIAQIKGALQTIKSQAQSVGSAFKSMGTMQNLGGAMRGLGSSLRNLGGMVMSVVKPLAAVAGIAGGIGMAEAVAGMQGYVDNVKELSRTAPIIGTSVERLSELQLAASRVGISAETMTAAMLRANQSIAKAATGKGTDLTLLFDRMRIKLRDSTGQMRSSVDVLGEFANAITRQTNPVLKQRMAMELFGRAHGPELLKLLNEGKGGIDAFIAEARRLNLVVGPEREKEALAFASAQGTVRRSWEAMSIQLSQNLVPIMTRVVTLFGKLFEENREAIVQAITRAFKAMGDALDSVNWEKTIADIKAWGATIQWIVGLIGGWKTVIGLVIAAMGAPFIAAMLSVVAAITKVGVVLASLAVANPIIAAIIVGVAALAYAGYLIYKHWGAVKQFFVDLWDGVKAAFVAFDEWLGPWGNLFAPTLIYRNWDSIASFFSGLWDGVKAVFTAVADWLGPWGNLFLPFAIYNNWEGIKEFFVALWESPKETFLKAIDWLVGFYTAFTWEPLKAVWEALPRFFDERWKLVTAIFERAWAIIKPIVDAIKTAIGWITDNVPSLGKVGDALKGAGAAVFNAPGRALDWAGGKLGFGGGAAPDTAGDRVRNAFAGNNNGAVLQAAPSATPARVDGEVDVKIHMTGAPPGTTIETREQGQVRAAGDPGMSMAPA